MNSGIAVVADEQEDHPTGSGRGVDRTDQENTGEEGEGGAGEVLVAVCGVRD